MKAGFIFQAGGKTWIVEEVIQSWGADMADKKVDPLTGGILSAVMLEAPVEVVVRLRGHPVIEMERNALPVRQALPAPVILLEDRK